MPSTIEPQDPRNLAHRLVRLERDLRFYRLITVAGALLGLAAFCMILYQKTSGRLEAESFALISPGGDVLSEWAPSEQGLPGLYLYDGERHTRAWLGVVDDGSPQLVLADQAGRPRTTLLLDGSHQGNARLFMYDQQGQDRVTLGLSDKSTPRLVISNEQGKPVYTAPSPVGGPPQQRWVTLNDAGSRAFVKGRLDEAEKLYLAALKVAQGFGPKDLRIAATLNNLGVLNVRRGKLEQAEKAYQHALAVRRSVLGDDHPQVAQSLSNLAFLRRTQGKAGEAEALYRQAIAIWERHDGKESPGLVSSLTGYAELLRQLKKDKEAALLDRRVEEIRKKQEASKKASPTAGGHGGTGTTTRPSRKRDI